MLLNDLNFSSVFFIKCVYHFFQQTCVCKWCSVEQETDSFPETWNLLESKQKEIMMSSVWLVWNCNYLERDMVCLFIHSCRYSTIRNIPERMHSFQKLFSTKSRNTKPELFKFTTDVISTELQSLIWNSWGHMCFEVRIFWIKKKTRFIHMCGFFFKNTLLPTPGVWGSTL